MTDPWIFLAARDELNGAAIETHTKQKARACLPGLFEFTVQCESRKGLDHASGYYVSQRPGMLCESRLENRSLGVSFLSH